MLFVLPRILLGTSPKDPMVFVSIVFIFMNQLRHLHDVKHAISVHLFSKELLLLALINLLWAALGLHCLGFSLQSAGCGGAGFRLQSAGLVVQRPSCSEACGVVPDRASNRSPLHPQAD